MPGGTGPKAEKAPRHYAPEPFPVGLLNPGGYHEPLLSLSLSKPPPPVSSEAVSL